MKVLIEVQCYNRKETTDKCLTQLVKYKQDWDLRIMNDYSTEYDSEWLGQFTDDVQMYETKLNINRLKYRTFKRFIEEDKEYTHLYMTDNDMFHDKEYVNFLKKYSKNNLPITLYKGSFIHSFGNGVSRYLKDYGSVSLKSGLYGGQSVFLNREQVQNIYNKLDMSEDEWDVLCEREAWDSKIQRMIDSKRYYLLPNNSYCEHFGQGGQNHKTNESDYGLNLTEYLKGALR